MKSQKALGTTIAGMSLLYKMANWHFELVTSSKEALDLSFPKEVMFARPCPTVPRHGFVESRKVKTAREVISLLEEARQEDPNAEVMVGQVIEAKCSAILTGDGALIIGPGHDGATSGKGSISLPVVSVSPMPTIYDLGKVKTNPYFELVQSINNNVAYLPTPKPYVVQMRDGPLLPSGETDFIPGQIKVNYVVEPHDDLLRWERECQNFKPGTVVYGKGHGLGSHAAVHCVLNNVPFVISSQPNVGDILKPTKTKPFQIDTKEVRLGLGWAASLINKVSFKREVFEGVLGLSLAVLHNWSRLQYSPLSSRLMGAALGGILICASSAIAGELRHSKINKSYDDREEIYQKTNIFSKAFLSKIPLMGVIFNSKNFDSGYGGPLWADGSAMTSQLAAAMSKEKWTEAFVVANKLVNASHNGGYLLNKFIDDSMFDFTANEPGPAIALYIGEIFELTKFNLKLGINIKIPYVKPDTEKYVGMSGDNIVGLDESWDQRIPSGESTFLQTFKNIYHSNADGWFPFKTNGKTIFHEDTKNNIIWEIV